MMNEHEHIPIITCHNCGHRSEYVLINTLDSEDDVYEKNQLLNGTLFDHKCSQCGAESSMLYELTYIDQKKNFEIYLVHEGHFDGAHMMLHMIDNVDRRYGPDDTAPRPNRRIVTCHHKLREKVMILDAGLDDRIIEIVKIICMNDAMENIPDFEPMDAEFDIKDGKHVIHLYGEDRVITAMVPEGIVEHLAHEFADILIDSAPYVVDEYWAMNAMGIDPFDDHDEVDCDNCSHRQERFDDFDDFDGIDDLDNCRCEDCTCEFDCHECPCDNCDVENENCAECEHNCLNRTDIDDGDEYFD